jgi:hypothetical protein
MFLPMVVISLREMNLAASPAPNSRPDAGTLFAQPTDRQLNAPFL